MDLFFAAKHGDLVQLKALIEANSGDVDWENPNFASMDETRSKKSIYCAECYQRVKRRDRSFFNFTYFGCDWPTHLRSSVINDPHVDACGCKTPHGTECNWVVCVDCFVRSTYDLKASHQKYGLQEGATPLIAAASGGHMECVQLLLDHGADIEKAGPVSSALIDKYIIHALNGRNTHHQNELTALLAASSAGHSKIVKLLLERGANVNKVEQDGMSALSMACDSGDVTTVEIVLGFNPDLTICENGGATPLHAAASAGHLGIMTALLDRGLDPCATDEKGDTPLHWLPASASAAAVRLLIDRGADLDAQNSLQYTPILLAALRDSPVVVSTLLNAGARCDVDTEGWGTPLTASCLGNFPRVTEVLLAGGVDHTIGLSVLDLCSQRDLPVNAEICLKYGVQGAGDALVRAADMGKPNVVKVFLQHWTGEDDMDNEYMHKALCHASANAHVPCVKLLLLHGADPTYRYHGQTAADFTSNAKIKTLIKAHLEGTANYAPEEDDEETKGKNRNHLQNALKKGTKKWGRSKIMIVGDGRAGKTALANSIMGEEFAHTESTIGINQMTCDVKFAEVGKEGQWDEYVKPDKELEAALAKIVAARRNGEEDEEDETHVETRKKNAHKAASTHADSAKGDVGTGGGGGGGVRKTGADVSISSYEATQESPAGVNDLLIDDALVMKYLANLTDTTKFVISLFDYGGQTVFNVIHHLFLTRYGVYTLVFNMEQLVSTDPAVRANCLSTISFWLNSIVVHTWNTETESMAPIVIVGTHKDVVNDPADHIEISRILHDKFCSSVAWPSIQENEETEDGGTSLCFFPVDNRKSRKDTTVQKMMKLIEDIIDKSDYVHVERPLTWLQTMDKLTASGKAFLPLVEVEEIARQCDVPLSAVPSLLSFLHEMGIVMWHDDVSLRDIVILDAVSYFVTPVTTIICKHLSTAIDTTRHVVDVHKKCRKQYYDAWMKMVHHGIVNTDIIGTLLQDCGQHLPIVLHLMVKFGLIVPLQIAEQVYGVSKSHRMNEFLVPALLPSLSEAPEQDKTAVRHSSEYTNTCLFGFSCSNRLVDSSCVTFSDTTNLGFLPRGLFERLICKAVEWCRETSAVQSLQSQPLFQDAAVLVFGNQKFRMRAFHDKNVIEVNFTAGNPLAVHQRLSEQLQQILDECMKSLRFFTLLPYPAARHSTDGDDANNSVLSSKHLISLEYLRAMAKKHTGLNSPTGEHLLSKQQVVEQYGSWIVDDTLRNEYDVFISYRWGAMDSKYTERLRDRFSTYNVGEENRAVSVFLDNKRLRDGRNFVDDFARALVNSLIIVPVVSTDALQRMRLHDPYQKDHALMEWFMALECFHSADSRVTRVLPVLFGSRDGSSDAIGNLFAEGVIESLPELFPKESIRTALALLEANGVTPRFGVSTYTVRSIVSELKAILGFCAWTAPDPSCVVAHSATRIFESLQEVLEEGPKKVQQRQMKAGPQDESEDMLMRPPRGDGAVNEETSTKQSSNASPHSGNISPTKRTVKDVMNDIKDQLGLGADVSMNQVFQQALEFIGDEALTEACKKLGGLAKAEKILSALLGE